MRVIGGRSRGRRLAAKLPRTVRPTSDRVRESIFDILGSQGGVEGLRTVDLFCGSGALGLEALSRGAASVTFVDQDPIALDAVRTNLAAVGLDGEAVTLVRAALPGWLRTAAAGTFDLALCDPPYDFGDWAALLGALQADVAVLESSASASTPVPEQLPEPWVVTKARRYGGTLVTVAHRNGVGS
ncbi:MAG TPA: 16S rRNA (guanine(966)-N(2))-methyltransferase RsmD [Acidimicrobiales bacterium]|nr:16S rRNA (guanine(966)-N(2))-methyltransferase RsmD [Acidimicrobiales bacterium]